jgi:hypothetical protein
MIEDKVKNLQKEDAEWNLWAEHTKKKMPCSVKSMNLH